jgi:hypothetical protein
MGKKGKQKVQVAEPAAPVTPTIVEEHDGEFAPIGECCLSQTSDDPTITK